MSFIYSNITKLFNKITEEFHKSFLFINIFSILNLLENKCTNNIFKRFYPSENFLIFIERSNILKNHIFNPLIVLIIFLVFLAISSCKLYFSLIETLIIAFLFFFIGSSIMPRFFLNGNIEVFSFKRNDVYSMGFLLMIISFIFFLISIASVGGLPILKLSLRYSIKPVFTMPVFLIIPGTCILASVYLKDFQNEIITRSQVRFRFLVLLLVNIMLLLLLAYRTPIIASLLILIIIAYFGGIISVWEVIIAGIIGVGVIMGIGYYRSLEEFAISSATNPFYSLKSRVDFTLHVLNLLDSIGGNFGLTHGKLIASSIPGSEIGPRRMVGKLIGWRSEVTITPTLLGQMVADFGKVGVAFEMGILGFILGIGFKIMKKTKNFAYIGIYSLILTYAIVGIETGILDIQVLAYFVIAFFIYACSIFKNNLSHKI